MTMVISTVSALLIFEQCARAADKKPADDLFKHYRGKVVLPDDLGKSYSAFIKAVETAKPDNIKKHCLPFCVSFTTEIRPEKSRGYGTDINIPFLKEGFNKYVMSVRRDSRDAFLIRTASSYMWFVRTRSEGWKLYRYGDKPIR